MERLAIIDHETHTLYIEDVSDERLAKYNGDEEAYIKDTYEFNDGFSWDYIVCAEYLPNDDDDADFIDIDFNDLVK